MPSSDKNIAAQSRTAGKKSIAIDGNEANIADRVGTGEYTYNLLSRFAKMTDRADFDIYLRDNPVVDMSPAREGWQYHVIGPWRGWTRLAFPYHLLTGKKHDVVWNPAHYLPPFTRSPGVVTIHDLAYEYYPELFLRDDLYKLKKWTRSSVDRAAKVIAVSEATKKDLISLYQVPESKIAVVYNGFDQGPKIVSAKLSDALMGWRLVDKKYLLFVGTLQPRKNIVRLIQAFRLLKQSGYPGKLVIAGKIGWLAEETLNAINTSPDAANIIMTGYISRSTKFDLYRHADLLVLPSLYEGFGVPVLEAFASGCPVVAADNSSLPEVVGGAGVLFEAGDPADIVRAIRDLKQSRASWVAKGLKRAKDFSWDKCAKETLAVLLNA